MKFLKTLKNREDNEAWPGLKTFMGSNPLCTVQYSKSKSLAKWTWGSKHGSNPKLGHYIAYTQHIR